MNEQTQSPEEETPLQDELAMLKERARTLGISVGNIGLDKLREKISAKLNGLPDTPDPEPVVVAAAVAAPRVKTKKEIEQEIRERLQREEMKMVRCRIYNLNPTKRDLRGEIITVANKYLGTVRKFIPFGEATENGYHIPMVLYKDLKVRKFQQINTRRQNGQIIVDNRVVPEYNIEILTPLTVTQLAELATRQAAAERLGA